MFSPIYWDWQAGSRLLAAGVDGVSVIARGLDPFVRDRGARDVILVPGVEGWGDLPPAPDRLASSNFSLLYVSALIRRDNPEMLFECLRRARRMGAPIILKVTGRYAANPEAAELLGRVQSDPELSRAVQFLGELSDQQLRGEMRASDGLVLLRRDAETEVCSFPTRLVEYLQQGRPVVISDVGDISAYLEDGRDAVLLDRRDADRAARQLDALAKLPDRGHALGLAGRNRGANEFDRKQHAQRLLEFAKAASVRRAASEAER
jgi:glycosyltransferase involved in cell wall biosynthesis